jgi:hypothetical protein
MNRQIWRLWADQIHRWGLSEVVASFLDAIGPLSFVGAQVLYFGQPFLRPLASEKHLDGIARLLEDPLELNAFVTLLREESAR